MRRVASLIVVAVCLAGCGRGPQKADEKAEPGKPSAVVGEQPKPQPVVAEQPGTKQVIPPRPTPGTETGRVQQVANPVPPAEIAPKKPAASTTNATAAPARDVERFLERSPFIAPSQFRLETSAGKALAQAHNLMAMEGRTNEAVEVLMQAMKDPSCEPDRLSLAQQTMVLLLTSDRVEEAKALSMEFSKDEKTAGIACIIYEYLSTKGDFAGAAEWTAHIDSLPLSRDLASQNYANRIGTLVAAGRLNEAEKRALEFVGGAKYTNQVNWLWSTAFIMRTSGNSAVEPFLKIVREQMPDKKAYDDMARSLERMAQAESDAEAEGRPATVE